MYDWLKKTYPIPSSPIRVVEDGEADARNQRQAFGLYGLPGGDHSWVTAKWRPIPGPPPQGAGYTRQMINVSETAASKISELLIEEQKSGGGLRVYVQGGGCSGFQYGMSFDVPKEGDQQLDSEGVPFLIDPTSHAYLDGSVIDFDDGLHGKGFEIKNPNAQSTCGCGKSFS